MYANRLAQYRRKLGLSQAALGQVLAHPMRQEGIARIETGAVMPLLETAREIVDALNARLPKPVAFGRVFPRLRQEWEARGGQRGGRRG